MENNWEVVTDHYCMLGEGPVWDHKEKRIFWIDILKGKIHYYYPDRYEHMTYGVGQMVGAIALTVSGGIIAAVKGGFAVIEQDKRTIRYIAPVESHLPHNRFNDGKVDPAGRFWAGSMSISNTPGAGTLYTLEKDLSVKTKITGVTCSNGLAWSPDNKTLYYIDTPTRQVVSYRYDVISGDISDKKVIIEIPKSDGYPDGMTIDEEGMLWIALWGGWKIARYDPFTGKQLSQIRIPVSRVTSCVFGGDTLEDLYVTTAKPGQMEHDLKKEPLAGALFVIKNCGFKGIIGTEFDCGREEIINTVK